jgi:cytochrome c553
VRKRTLIAAAAVLVGAAGWTVAAAQGAQEAREVRPRLHVALCVACHGPPRWDLDHHTRYQEATILTRLGDRRTPDRASRGR